MAQWLAKDGGYTQNTRKAWISELQENMSYRVKVGDIMQALFEIFKQSIEIVDEDKQYFLDKLAEMNKISQELENELKDLTAAMKDLQDQINASGQSGRHQPVTVTRVTRDFSAAVLGLSKQQSSVVQNIRTWLLNTVRAHDAKIANLRRDWPKIQENMIRDFKAKVFRRKIRSARR